jgi:uncharacterized protein YyaL (SSP411 family)
MEHTSHRNRLADAGSPYLQAHAHNPVDWYEWGDEAFARAESEDKPVFLSIGYHACHWCHVMERESFTDENIAQLLNRHFISIKVDREERPDIDHIYMAALQAMTGSGGWPMTIFMTPDRKPFFAGTYFPPDTRHGRPGFKQIIEELARGYRETRDEITRSANAIADHIAAGSRTAIPPRMIDQRVITSAAKTLMAAFDSRFGGFGGAPKFPRPVDLSFLFRATHATGDGVYAEAALLTLRKMAEGGIHDQLGGGFHRYAVDREWLVPHFEKMLYDNALLAVTYLEGYQVSGDEFYLRTAHRILQYLQSQMIDPEGGLYSAQDADSEGEEGKYYLWTKQQIDEVLGTEADWVTEYLGVTSQGNFEGKNILTTSARAGLVRKRINLRDDEFESKLSELRGKLLAEQRRRIPPATDDKILASWNGLAISAFAQAYQISGDGAYLVSAVRAADFILQKMIHDDILYHSYRKERLLRTELLEDYAYFIAGLLDLYQASFDERYLDRAVSLGRRAVAAFFAEGVFYSSAADKPDLIFRPRDLMDGATPSPASVMILNLLRLAALTGDIDLGAVGEQALTSLSGVAARIPQASSALLLAGHFAQDGPVEIVIAGNDPDQLAQFSRAIFARHIPNKIIAGSIDGRKSRLPLLEGRQEVDRLTIYICRGRTCRQPVTDITSLRDELDWVVNKPRSYR